MHSSSRRWVPSVALALLLGSVATARPSPQGTSFTYQGQLKQGATLVNTTADFQFTLFDALTVGNQIGTMQPANAVALSNGQFTVSLDFGASAFDGNERFLQIAVRSPAGSGSFTTLSPRQKLAATPYALQTRGITVDAANNVGIGTTSPTAPLHIAADLFPTIFIQDTGSPAAQTGYVSYRNNANVETGWVGYGTAGSPVFSMVNARAGGDIELFSIAGGSIRLTTNALALIVDPAGNVGIGTTTPQFRLDVVDAGVGNTFAIRGDGTQVGVEGHNGINPNGGGTAVLGICDSPSGFDFYAQGAGVNYGSPSSIRWKRNIELIDSPLEKVAAMRGVMFDWDAPHGGQHDVGFIGEEVGKVLPEVVAYEADGKYVRGMDYSKLTPLLVEAVKALRVEKDAQIAQQQEQIAALQHDNQHLQDRLAALEAGMARLNDRKEEQ